MEVKAMRLEEAKKYIKESGSLSVLLRRVRIPKEKLFCTIRTGEHLTKNSCREA